MRLDPGKLVEVRKLAAAVVLAALLGQPALAGAHASEKRSLVLLHFTDYHSHALPFYSEGRPAQAGAARVVGYLRAQRKSHPDSLIFNGGDTMNKSTPAWSDKYRCQDWAWFDGLVDALAIGNHEFDYGSATLDECAKKSKFPILVANLVSAENQPIYERYRVFTRGKGKKKIRVGVFALAGEEFSKLVKPQDMPAGARFTDGTATARELVQMLRTREKVNAVVLIGHRKYEEDLLLAAAVPGIDVIFGTHSHRRQELMKIEGTNTWYLSPYQYLTYVSRLELGFDARGKLSKIEGKLVRMDESLPEADDLRVEIQRKQKELVADPLYADRFRQVGVAASPLSNDLVFAGESTLANLVLDTVRRRLKAHAMVSTASSFRATVPPGPILLENFMTALPYRNRVLRYELDGKQVRALFALSASKVTTDGFLQVSGARLKIRAGKVEELSLLKDPEDESKGYLPVSDSTTYKVLTTDFLAGVAPGYREFFLPLKGNKLDLEITEAMLQFLKDESPVSASSDGRITVIF